MKKLKTKGLSNLSIPAGFTLVEMMIVLTILGLVVVGVMGVIISQNRVYHSEEDLIDMQLNANVAMDRLTRQIKMAGFGCKDDIKKNGLNIDGTTYNAVFTHVNNTDTTTNAKGSDQLTVICALEQVSDVDNDGVSTTTPSYNDAPTTTIYLSPYKDSTPNPFFDSSADDKKFFYISPSSTQKTIEVKTADSGSGSIGIETAIKIDEFSKAFRVRAYTYSIKPVADYNSTKPPAPNIVQKIETQAASPGRVEIAEGIEDLQFQFGWDINNDGIFNPSSAADWVDTIPAGDEDKVIAVKIILLGITLHPEQEKQFTDLYDDQPGIAGRQYTQADHTITYTASGYKYGPHYHRHRLESTVFIRNLNF